MRKATRAVVLAFLAFLSSVLIVVAAVMTAAVTLAATALIVPGTGTHNIDPPNAVQGYKENAANRFIGPATTAIPPSPFFCTASNGCTLDGIDYPASFWPIPIPGWCPGLSCDKWNVSVATGVTNLDTAISQIVGTGEPMVLFGYSQGGQVVTNEMYKLLQQYPNQLGQFKVVTIGNIGNPQGLWSRFNFLPGFTVPILDVTFGPQLPTKGIESYNFSFEYDPVGDAPLNWWNPLAVLNALAAFQYVHGNYLVPNTNDPTASLPYGYTDATLAQTINAALSNCTEGPGSNCRTYQDAKFILIPWQGTLPLLQPVMDLADSIGITPIVKPFVDLIQPALKVLIDLGYDRVANPGIPRTMNLLPIFNPIKLAIDLVFAVGQGIQGFINDITGNTPAPAAPLAPSGPVSTFASVNAAVDDDTVKLAQTDQNDVTDVADQSKLDALAAKKRVPLDDSTVADQVKTDPLKVDTTLDAKVDPLKTDPKSNTDGALNPAFSISPQNTSNGSITTSTAKSNDGNTADVIELKPTQVEAANGSTSTGTSTTTSTTTSTGTNVTTGQGPKDQQQQQQGTTTSSSTGQQQAAA